VARVDYVTVDPGGVRANIKRWMSLRCGRVRNTGRIAVRGVLLLFRVPALFWFAVLGFWRNLEGRLSIAQGCREYQALCEEREHHTWLLQCVWVKPICCQDTTGNDQFASGHIEGHTEPCSSGTCVRRIQGALVRDWRWFDSVRRRAHSKSLA